MHDAIVDGARARRVARPYLDDTGHMSGVDPLLGLDRAVRDGRRRRRRRRAPARRRYRLHVGGDRRTMGAGMSASTIWRDRSSGRRAGSRSTQERIDAFAEATEDRQWIHVDPERAAAGPFGTTIAHGFLTLSLCVPLLSDVAAGSRARR